MKSRGLRRIIAFALLVFFLPAVSSALAAEAVKDKKKLAEVKEKLGRERHRVRKILRKESSILLAINRLNRDLNRTSSELKRLRASKKRLERKRRAERKKKERIERDLEKQRARVAERLRAMYKMRSGELLNMAFAPGADDPVDVARRHKYMTAVTDYDASVLSAYEAKLKARQAALERLDALNADIEKSAARLRKKRAEQKKLKSKKVALLTRVRREKESGMKILKELEAAAKELSGLIESLDRERASNYSGFGAMKGHLPMPVRGVIVSRYGKVRHPKFKTITFNKGIIIKAPSGKRVKSVYDGRVIYTGWLKGYGQIIIIDHGGGFYTLFAYLDRVLKKRGERVERGEAVALVGDTGPYAEPGLYFEIRKKGVPQDPARWLARK